MNKPFKTLYYLAKSARPLQWLKNIALFAPLLFSGFLFFDPVDGPSYMLVVAEAFLTFCILTSSTYLFNDVVDKEADQKHPYKKERPIASGELPVPVALFAAFIGFSLVFLISWTFTPFFRILVLAYLILQIVYSFHLKHLPIFDVLSIAAGFLIRIYAGAVVLNLHMSVWFLLTVISASLFLAVGKRQSERTLLGEERIKKTRKALHKYGQRLLDVYTSMFANATWLTYALYTFQTEVTDPDMAHERFPYLYKLLPRTWQLQKLLMLTVPLVIFGVMRYLALIYEDNKGESPEKVLVNDKTLLATVFVYIFLTMTIIYF
jgi:4-hydroxybenzoate polyprenyltransferase